MGMIFSYPESLDEVSKMHRTINSEDVIEYPMHVRARDVSLHEEEDIEYRDGRLTKSNGTMSISIDTSKTSADSNREESDDEFSNVFSAHGSFTMELRLCRVSSRRERAVQENVDSSSSVEEGLMATVDESMWIISFFNVCKHYYYLLCREDGNGDIGNLTP